MESGCNVCVLCCDVSGEALVVSILAAVHDISARGGIRGIIHVAGVIRDSLIREDGAVMCLCAVLMCCACVLVLCVVLVCCACVLCLCCCACARVLCLCASLV